MAEPIVVGLGLACLAGPPPSSIPAPSVPSRHRRPSVPASYRQAATQSPEQADGAPRSFSFLADLRRETADIIRSSLDADRLRELRAQGGEMDDARAVAYALDALLRAQGSG